MPNILTWDSECCISDDQLFLRNHNGKDYVYRLPIGGNLKQGVDKILAFENNTPLFWAAEGHDLNEFMILYSEMYALTEDQNSFDYVYLTEDLKNLSGKKYQSKRNHISSFSRKNQWYYEPISESVLPLINDCIEKWYTDNTSCDSLIRERDGIEFVLKNMKKTNIDGGCLIVDGKCVAFSYGVAINSNMFDICIEKALADYPEAYTVINHELAKRIGHRFINRENDMGIDGLRKAKMSYRPYQMVKKYYCIGKEQKIA